MICQNCQATVDNDLIFCTSCGARLNETWNQAPTALINESVVTQTTVPPIKQKSGSGLKWAALIVALIALPVSLFVAYRFYIDAKQPQQIAANQTKAPATNSQPPLQNRQVPANTNASTNIVNNTNATNSNTNASNNNANSASNVNGTDNLDDQWLNGKAPADKRTEIWSERIGVAPESHYAVPFELDGDGQIIGNIKTLEGPPVEGYVYLQSVFDEHFPDPTFKMFSFGGEKSTKVEQTLVKEKYVLVFVNKSKTPLMIYGKFFTVKQ